MKTVILSLILVFSITGCASSGEKTKQKTTSSSIKKNKQMRSPGWKDIDNQNAAEQLFQQIKKRNFKSDTAVMFGKISNTTNHYIPTRIIEAELTRKLLNNQVLTVLASKDQQKLLRKELEAQVKESGGKLPPYPEANYLITGKISRGIRKDNPKKVQYWVQLYFKDQKQKIVFKPVVTIEKSCVFSGKLPKRKK